MTDCPQKASILVVDDTIDNLQVMAGMLNERGYEARPVPNGRLALQAANLDPPDLILLDINMPHMSGYEVCERLKASAATHDIPVIFISALDEALDKVRAFRVGGSDYVTKPFEYEEVFARVEAHLALRRAHAELERSYRSLSELEEMRDTLVHMIVHDMRTPLQVLLANGQLLQQTLGAEHADDINDLLDSVERLQTMANTVLDVSRLESGRMPLERRNCDVSALASEVARGLQSVHTQRKVSVDAPPALNVCCDGALVRRVLENLLSNGLKHTPAGSSVNVLIASEAAAIRVSVQDDGPGISTERQLEIFEKFGALRAQAGDGSHSAGLGLAMCRLAVAAHGGEIGVDSAPGQGARFWFTLPHAASV